MTLRQLLSFNFERTDQTRKVSEAARALGEQARLNAEARKAQTTLQLMRELGRA